MGGSLEQAVMFAAAREAHVAVEGLTKRFGSATVLDGVDLSVGRGELVTLLGPSGCGKTTLLRVIAGLASPDAGRVVLAGAEVTRTPPHKRNVGVVFQNYALFPHLDVGGNVGFGLSNKGLSKATLAERTILALDLVQMGAFRDRPVTALSGGQQQRVALARALAVEPSVLLFDEALSALDRNLRETMQSELRRLLKGLDATAIFVTHDQDEALAMSDRIAVMNAGRIEQLAEPLEVYARPASLFTMRFLGLSSELRGRVLARDGETLRVETSVGAVSAQGDYPIGAEVVVATRPEHVRLGEASLGDNAAQGRIKHITFQGSRTRLTLDIGGADFPVETHGADPVPAMGDQVRLAWPASRSFAYSQALR